ncbi:hypothetical protein [Gemmatimonas groenlandica]|uniref:Uncharacterized protein n=1 Tax=Gemmatimonas groenlandica TaxID=2732249 RepID=A0A6M4IXT2_9BACT|nr:hypothetical protein [Gemmatimonas groenlandica]QJR37702.1 hypothetical protein HKW67_20340 [Gemmatimonas groenlandica]
MSLTQEEVTPGLVIQLDTATLRALGGCQTNAVLGPEGDRSVVGTQDFLLVGLDAASGRCTAVPLFAKTAVGNQPLESGKKTGPADQWIGTDTYFSRWQHWRIPVASVVAASAGDPTAPANRRRYAASDRSALDDIKNWEGRNRAAYRDA